MLGCRVCLQKIESSCRTITDHLLDCGVSPSVRIAGYRRFRHVARAPKGVSRGYSSVFTRTGGPGIKLLEGSLSGTTELGQRAVPASAPGSRLGVSLDS